MQMALETLSSLFPTISGCFLTTLGSQPLLSWSTALLPLRRQAQFSGQFILHSRKADQESFLVYGFLQGFDGWLQFFLHFLPHTVQIAAGWRQGEEIVLLPYTRRRSIISEGSFLFFIFLKWNTNCTTFHKTFLPCQIGIPLHCKKLT